MKRFNHVSSIFEPSHIRDKAMDDYLAEVWSAREIIPLILFWTFFLMIALMPGCKNEASTDGSLHAEGKNAFTAKVEKSTIFKPFNDAQLVWNSKIKLCYISGQLSNLGDQFAFVDVPAEWCEGMR